MAGASVLENGQKIVKNTNYFLNLKFTSNSVGEKTPLAPQVRVRLSLSCPSSPESKWAIATMRWPSVQEKLELMHDLPHL